LILLGLRTRRSATLPGTPRRDCDDRRLRRDLGASVSVLQWTLTSYLLTVAALLLLSGALSDRGSVAGTNTALTGATYDIDGGQQIIPR
jgi:hypothetical protein